MAVVSVDKVGAGMFSKGDFVNGSRNRAFRTVVCGALAIPVAIALSGCSNTVDRPDATVAEMQLLCTEGTAFTGAAPYDGNAPHPMVMWVDGSGTGYLRMSLFPGIHVDDDVRGQLHGVSERITDGVANIQLVGCLERKDARAAGKICEYTRGSAPLAVADYELNIYEAQTAELVSGPIVIPPQSTECPDVTMLSFKVAGDEVYPEPDAPAVVPHVRAVVDG